MPSHLIEDDRPFAGALMLSFGYNARRGDSLRTSQIRVGVVGPASRAQQVQDWWHGVIGVDRFNGWDHQLRDEPVVQLIHERRKRVARRIGTSGWGWDYTRHWGMSLGNFATYANAGGELRFGLRLPDDFGTAPLRPAGENTAPVMKVAADQPWNWHLFVAADARWVLHDITLDGNTFKSSHSVDKRPFVADLGYGAAIYRGHWRFAFARYFRTREFHGQKETPVYGNDEREIACQAACALRESFITAAQSGPVLYVENDTVLLKEVGAPPIVIKHLAGRNPELAQRVVSRGTFKIKKCKVSQD